MHRENLEHGDDKKVVLSIWILSGDTYLEIQSNGSSTTDFLIQFVLTKLFWKPYTKKPIHEICIGPKDRGRHGILGRSKCKISLTIQDPYKALGRQAQNPKLQNTKKKFCL